MAIGGVVVMSIVTGIVIFLLAPSGEPASQTAAGSSPPAVPTAPNPSVSVPTPSSAETPDAAATADFTFDGTRPGYQTSFYALGWVKNTSPFPIRKPAVTAVLQDADGKEVGTHRGYAEADVLEPGQRAPISLLVKDPATHESMDFEVAPKKATYVPEVVDGLQLEPTDAARASFGDRWVLSGKVHHKGDKPAKFVRILALGFDGNDKLLGVFFTFADAEVLQPGASTRFRISSASFAEKPSRFEYSVSGRVAK